MFNHKRQTQYKVKTASANIQIRPASVYSCTHTNSIKPASELVDVDELVTSS